MIKKEKIDSLYLHQLQNAQYYQCMENTLRLLKKNQALLKADHLIEGLEKGLGDMFVSFKKEKTNALTERVLFLDQKRDRFLRKISLFVRAYELDEENPENQQAAKKILAVFDLYGGSKIYNFDHNKETASLSNLVHDLNSKNKSALLLLKLAADVSTLEEANKDFKDLYNERTDFVAEQNEALALAQIRKQMNQQYQIFCKWVDGLPSSAELKLFIAALNVEIAKFHALIVPKKKEEEKKEEKVAEKK